MVDLSGHVAIVTGANHGIGAATARALAAAGAPVLVTYLRVEDPVDSGTPEGYRRNRLRDASDVVTAIRQSDGVAEAVEADLTDTNAPANLFDTAERALGPVDILINNATGWVSPPDTFKDAASDRIGRSLQAVSAPVFDRLFAVDARASALLIAELARRNRARGAHWGRIVSLISGGPGGFPEEVSYGAAKSALSSYTMAAATELAEIGVTANCVHPPITDTGWVTDSVRQLGATRIAQPDEVAEVILYLVSDAARWVTGNVIYLR